MKTSAQKRPPRTGLLGQHAWFDGTFIVGTLGLALGLTGIASFSPAMLIAVVLIDTWLFANPHVVATFTRIGASLVHVRRYRFLIFGLPVIVLGGVVATALAYEISGLFTLYFIAQSYHVARQSFGVARAYRRAGSTQPFQADRLSETLIYMVAAWGLLARCAESPKTFLEYPIELPAVPTQVAEIAGVATIVCGAWWLWRLAHKALAREIDWRHDGFVASHVCANLAAYIWITDITLGWLVINLWHNLQYLQFVWVQNIRRDAEKSSERTSTTLFWKSARQYICLCLLLGALLYLAVDWVGTQLLWLGLPTVLIAHFTLNFHHYLVDGVIWKQHRAPSPCSAAARG
ncbi:hypothetical protein HS961_03095 [Comamonas piscis]|uniref:Uncharacterized protein n=1 Tax=Comamonas piscis TaxID=1562974 RepID=A0A7G5ED22_9BURK|nr:hypothetical protein [Comamonas piscis]QMV71897.1 hypothetical protein HS961_03095 [Comamonas piscis]WSO34636.1 hypothetical protein VUJ63_03115 [Comamonas piscis]